MSDDSPRRASGGREPGVTWPSVLSASVARLRRDPWLLLPFLVAGALRALVDWLRRRDPIPVREMPVPTADGLHVHVEYAGYPAGASRTRVTLDALVGLEVEYLAWGIGLQLLVVLAVAVAGALTIARAEDTEPSGAAVGRFLGYVVGFGAAHRVLGSVDLLQGMGPLGVVPLAILLYLYVQLFAVPGLLVEGRSVGAAVRESTRRVRGVRWAVAGLVFAIGIGTWLLAAVPHLGAALGTVVVAPLHAVAIVAVVERTADDPGGDRSATADRAGDGSRSDGLDRGAA